MKLTNNQKIELQQCKTLKQLIDLAGTYYDLESGNITIFNRFLIIQGIEQAIKLTNAKPVQP
jgi:hypothetical protein